MAIENALERFPRDVKTKAGLTVRLQPLTKTDHAAFHEFFSAMQPKELMYLKHRVTDPEVLRKWCENIDLGHNCPLLAWHDGKVVGVCTLHQALGGWKRHIGRLSAHVRPDFRNQGIARLLTGEVVEIARQCGLERLLAEFLGEQEQAMKVCALQGFEELYRLDDFVKDMQAISHNYVVMGLHLITDEEYAGMG